MSAMKTLESTVGTAAAALAQGTERAQELNEKVVALAKQASLLGLDGYEQTLGAVVGFQRKAADVSGLDWLSSMVEAQASLVTGLSANVTAAVREVLK